MKTPERKRVVARLNELNDQLRFFTFAEHELLDRLQDFSAALDEQFTPDVFARNPHARAIRVRLKDLPRFQRANRSFTFGAYVATSYEVVTTFFARAVSLAAECGTAIASPGQRAPEVKYAENVVRAGWTQPDVDVINLVSFVRRRRNAFVHMHDVPDADYVSYAAAVGPVLNHRWRASRGAIDFTIATVGGFGEDEAIDYIKLLRIAVSALDEHLASQLGEHAIVNYLARQTFGGEAVRVNGTVIQSRSKKLEKIARQEFGIAPSPQVLKAAASLVGVR